MTTFLVFNFTFAQTTQIDPNTLRQINETLQKAKPVPKSIEGPFPPEIKEFKIPLSSESTEVKTPELVLPRGIIPALPPDISDSKSIPSQIMEQILPDDDREDDVIVQLNNLRITRIFRESGEVPAIFFVVRDVGWRCLLYENKESSLVRFCPIGLRKPLAQKELAVKITNETILLQKNRQKAKLDDFQVNDKINVYGFMDKDNYGIEALIVRKIGTKIVPLPKPLPSPITPLPKPTTSVPKLCIQVITPAYNPNNPLECKEFPTPCDVPPGWIKTQKCKLNNE